MVEHAIAVEAREGALQPPAARLVGALEAAWLAIATRHPEVPEAVVVVGAGSERRQGLFKWGHFAAFRWRRGEQALHEVLVAGEGLQRPAEAVLGTLLHEGGHCLAQVRGLADTSRGGRYHNARYRSVAAELGLEVSQMGGFGWASTRLLPETAQVYADLLEDLRSALTVYRVAEGPGQDTGGDQGGGRRRSFNLLPAVCGCPRRIRIARSTLATGPIVCGLCGQPFAIVDPGDS